MIEGFYKAQSLSGGWGDETCFVGQVCDTRKNGDFERGVADEQVDVKKWQSKNGCKFGEMRDGWFFIAIFWHLQYNLYIDMRVKCENENTDEGISLIVVV